jgi:hypothetical protein
MSKCSRSATHFPVKFDPVHGLRMRLISHTQTSLQHCPARDGNKVRSTLDARIDRRRTPIIFISGTVKFKNRCVRLIYLHFAT